MKSMKSKFQGALLGLACGDAVGTTVEFFRRGRFDPVTDMVGGGKFRLLKGEWTDDTSMALCLAESLIECDGFDAQDQMERYWKWGDEGYLSCRSYAFGMGKTVANALGVFHRTGNAYAGSTEPNTAGNGSIMRLAPVVLYYYPDYRKVIFYAGESSRTTHGAKECVLSCQLLAHIVFKALDGASKEEILFSLPEQKGGCFEDLVSGAYKDKTIDEISGSGYVIESLEAALWCFYKTNSFKEAILAATNLGDDADTTAAICGQVAGAFYGVKGIPFSWLDSLSKKKQIVRYADELHKSRLF